MSFISSSYDERETVIPTVSETDYKLVQDLYDKVKGTKYMYNQKLIRTLEDRFDKLQAYLFRSFDGEEDLYSFIASIIYDKDYEDCCEWKNGEPNPQGKELRDRAKQFILPLVVECGGISEGEED